MRSNEYFTSSAVNSPKPSENIWPGFSRNSMTVGETCFDFGRGIELELGGIRFLLHQPLKNHAHDVAIPGPGAVGRVEDGEIAVDAHGDAGARTDCAGASMA